MFAQPITQALDLDDSGVVQQPVEQCGGNDVVAEHLTPIPETAVGGENHGAFFVALLDYLKNYVIGPDFYGSLGNYYGFHDAECPHQRTDYRDGTPSVGQQTGPDK